MPNTTTIDTLLAKLNPEQRKAATHDEGPLLIVAGAGTGKTTTLVHRVAWLVAQGIDPSRILLLTFTRRAAAEMLRRVDSLLRQLNSLSVGLRDDLPKGEAPAEPLVADQSVLATSGSVEVSPYHEPSHEPSHEDDDILSPHVPLLAEAAEGALANNPASPKNLDRLRTSRIWGGTFHAIATRLLRRYGKSIGLPPEFSVHDRTDSEDLMNVVRTELNLAKTDKRFPKKGTCMDIYSRAVNAQKKLETVLEETFPWCKQWAAELKTLFNGYVDRKEAGGVLDYDDLLLYWRAILSDHSEKGVGSILPERPEGCCAQNEPDPFFGIGDRLRSLFDCVLVDEYQDTNTLQAEIIYSLCPTGKGLTVVGDDAQSIYAFRAATVRNILDLPKRFPDAAIIPLEQNYRSSQPILDATNGVIALAQERFTKNLWSERAAGEKPRLVNCEDEADQAEYLIREILTHRESGIDLRRQAVLFRASHHSMMLEAELARRDIPFQKFGGLKFVETAHVKDLLAFLRLADNPLEMVAGSRLLPLLPGLGPAKSRQLVASLVESGGNFTVWKNWKPPAGATEIWPQFVELLMALAKNDESLPAQISRIRKFYTPILEQHYDNAAPRLRDLEQLELIASRYRNRRRMLLELTLDPPNSTQDFAGPPLLDDDYLNLSTIHSAKGLEWDVVFVIHAADGNIPSDMATKRPEEIEEERRLFYVALTRAKNHLYVCYPLRYYHSYRMGDRHGYAQRTRFLPGNLLMHFTQCVTDGIGETTEKIDDSPTKLHSRSIRREIKDLW